MSMTLRGMVVNIKSRHIKYKNQCVSGFRTKNNDSNVIDLVQYFIDTVYTRPIRFLFRTQYYQFHTLPYVSPFCILLGRNSPQPDSVIMATGRCLRSKRKNY